MKGKAATREKDEFQGASKVAHKKAVGQLTLENPPKALRKGEKPYLKLKKEILPATATG